jgi:hypothetical protein
VLAGSGGGVWTTDDTNISVCIVYLGVLWCMLGLKRLVGEKEYSYDRSWGRSAVVMVVEAF